MMPSLSLSPTRAGARSRRALGVNGGQCGRGFSCRAQPSILIRTGPHRLCLGQPVGGGPLPLVAPHLASLIHHADARSAALDFSTLYVLRPATQSLLIFYTWQLSSTTPADAVRCVGSPMEGSSSPRLLGGDACRLSLTSNAHLMRVPARPSQTRGCRVVGDRCCAHMPLGHALPRTGPACLAPDFDKTHTISHPCSRTVPFSTLPSARVVGGET